ncbi:MAG: hypothetical protein AAFV53_28365 [Myxococcota bacterium]
MESLTDFNGRLQALITEHRLRADAVGTRSRMFGELYARFFDGSIEVELVVAVHDGETGLHTLSLHQNEAGVVVLANDSDLGRQYHFPDSWFDEEATPEINEIEVNAWSRFSVTPDGRATGYKQQRFARDSELYFQGGRILKINDTPTEGVHTGKLLYAALKAHPGGVQLTIEG